MVKEVVRFRLPLGPRTDEFLAVFREVVAAMGELGVNPGVRWSALTGGREVMVEREFESLAQYEADDSAFHAGKDFMALWRRLEVLADSMEVEIWRNSATSVEVAAQRVRP